MSSWNCEHAVGPAADEALAKVLESIQHIPRPYHKQILLMLKDKIFFEVEKLKKEEANANSASV